MGIAILAIADKGVERQVEAVFTTCFDTSIHGFQGERIVGIVAT
jgi:hypothetical protein